MARTKKCDECRKDCVKETMTIIDYMTRNGNIRQKAYCSKECADEQETRKKLTEDTNNLLETILEMPIRTNMYFNKLYSPIMQHYGYKVIYETLHGEYSNICDALNKDFVNVNVKIKYFMAILQNKVEDYKEIQDNNKIESVPTVIETEEDIIIKPQKIKQRKSIFDI